MIIVRICKQCGIEYKTYPSVRKHFCSGGCYHKSKNGSGNPKWRGGKILVSGYLYIYKPDHPSATKDGYVCEHRLVIENHLKRFLNKKEAVHHINGNRIDNRLENLVVCKSNGKHSEEHHNVRDNKTGQYVSKNNHHQVMSFTES